MFAHGAGAASRQSLGSTVFAGMLAATCLGIFFIADALRVFQRREERARKQRRAPTRIEDRRETCRAARRHRAIDRVVRSADAVGAAGRADAADLSRRGRHGGSLGNVPWRKLYDDPVLQELIERALRRNFDVELAYAAILEADANLGITAANQSVFVNGAISAPYEVITGETSRPGAEHAVLAAGGDRGQLPGRPLWEARVGNGRGARSTARDRCGQGYRACHGRRAGCDRVFSAARTRRGPGVHATSRRIARRRRAADATARGGRRLLDARSPAGGTSALEVTQNIPTLRQNIAQTENALSVLIGDYPHAIARGLPLNAQVTMPVVPPAGVSGELLQRRPDIHQAEYTIAAAAGNVDVARKLLYPRSRWAHRRR